MEHVDARLRNGRPVWRALVTARHDYSYGERDLFCIQCHSAIGVRSGEVDPGLSFDEMSPVIQEGVTCEACHKVVGLERVFNSGHVPRRPGRHARVHRGPDPQCGT